MQNEKKDNIRRIIIYTVFTFGLVTLFGIPLLIITDTDLDSGGGQALSLIAAMTPAMGSLLARLVTKEGMKESYLRINFNGHEKYYLLAFTLPFIWGTLSCAGNIFLFDGEFVLDESLETMGFSLTGYIAVLFSVISSAFVMIPIYLGEELGWRGYLYPKLIKVMNKPLALIIGGIIWGAWHFMFIIGGANFGKDYAGYPYLGIGVMCLDCIFFGIIMQFLTERTGSVYPACIAHGLNNNAVTMMSVITDNGIENTAVKALTSSFGTAVVGIICAAVMIYSSRDVGDRRLAGGDR